MAILTKLKGLFGGKKKSQDQEYWEAWDGRIANIEGKVNVSQNVRQITGGFPEFESQCRELIDSLSNMLEGERKARAEAMIRRIEVALSAARIIREGDDEQERTKLWAEFIEILRGNRNAIHYKTRVKYDRLRLDYESGKLK